MNLANCAFVHLCILKMKNEALELARFHTAKQLKEFWLSPHFTLAELTKTNTGIDNVPNEEQVNNLKRVCRWLERLRQRWNDLYGDGDDPITIMRHLHYNPRAFQILSLAAFISWNFFSAALRISSPNAATLSG